MSVAASESHASETPWRPCKGAGGWVFHVGQDARTSDCRGGCAPYKHICDPQTQAEPPHRAQLEASQGQMPPRPSPPFSTQGVESVAETWPWFSASANSHNLWAHFSGSSVGEKNQRVCVCVHVSVTFLF